MIVVVLVMAIVLVIALALVLVIVLVRVLALALVVALVLGRVLLAVVRHRAQKCFCAQGPRVDRKQPRCRFCYRYWYLVRYPIWVQTRDKYLKLWTKDADVWR